MPGGTVQDWQDFSELTNEKQSTWDILERVQGFGLFLNLAF
ncbi:MAG: hypothetical protein ACI9FG_001979 [Crocinitomicaceae bacterium]|jgi:hypothetical protein